MCILFLVSSYLTRFWWTRSHNIYIHLIGYNLTPSWFIEAWRINIAKLPYLPLYSIEKNFTKNLIFFLLPFQVFDKLILLHEKPITNIEEKYTYVSIPPQTWAVTFFRISYLCHLVKNGHDFIFEMCCS